MTLYSKFGDEPVELPFQDNDTQGNTWTNLANNTAGRNACGWAKIVEPAYDHTNQKLVWNKGGWKVVDKDPSIVIDELHQAQQARLAELADLRWRKQQVMMFSGNMVPADDITISRCTAAREFAVQTGTDFDVPRNWKLANGVWTTLTTNDIIAYGVAIGTHMQACFDQEKILSDQIMAATSQAAIAAVDITAGWPN